ncbi:NAD(P)/FAD-dependent oxidoreductase [Gordonia jinhuaensis]|uniref:Pentachlorophenol monooxygenase n=1 Tax=Gordonia jinhuaensis TaxID=1517702 RepID=A0A916T6A4_9ACTN|nr:FAD-dependent monooxygenase [Gordonia jinhuaensis]GGB33323.1 pentachlorophenol monooxygenase [Gordonia jinhuaensis]
MTAHHSPESPILVVGAGPVGLTAALSAQQLGLPTRIIERRATRHHHSKAVVLWPRALEVLDRLGVAADIVAAGLPLHGQTYNSAGRPIASVTFQRITDSKYDFALAIPQHETERILEQAYRRRGGTVDFGHELVALSDHPDGVSASIRRSEEEPHVERFRWAIGADGYRSMVREQLGIPFQGATYAARFMLSDGPCEVDLDRTQAHYFMTKEGVVVVVPMPGNSWRIFASAPMDVADQVTPDVVESIASRRMPVPITFGSGHSASVFLIHCKSSASLKGASTFLVGDAAHVHSPAGGQGLNTGFEDATSLVWRLAEGPGTRRSDLDTWASERQSVIDAVLRDTDLQTRLWSARGRRAQLRDVILKGATATGLLDRFVAPRQAMLNTRYPAATRRRVGRLKVGARLSSVALTTSSGDTLHDLLSRSNYTTLHLDPHSRVIEVTQIDSAGVKRERSVPASPELFKSLRLKQRTRVRARPDSIVADVTDNL